MLVDGARIVGVEPGTAPTPDGCDVLEFPTGTVLPGLIDAHVHLCADSRDGALDRLPDHDEAALRDVIETALRTHLARGVTTVRDLGDRRFAVLEWRASSADGSPWPTIVAAGPPITSVAGHCWNMGGEASGVTELRLAVRQRAERGADVVKVMASGGFSTPSTEVLRCQFDADEMRAVVDEAHAQGLPVTAHAHGRPAAQQAIAAGVDGSSTAVS